MNANLINLSGFALRIVVASFLKLIRYKISFYVINRQLAPRCDVLKRYSGKPDPFWGNAQLLDTILIKNQKLLAATNFIKKMLTNG